MIKELIILDSQEKYSHTILIDECLSAVRDRQINSYNTFVFSVIKNESIEKDYRILFKDFDENKWYEYIVDRIVRDDDKVTFSCESSFYSTLSNYVDFVKVTGNTVVNGLSKIMNSCKPASDWNVGTSDIVGSFYMQRSRRQLKEVILAWVDAVDGELSERIEFYNGHIVRYIDILKRIGSDRGKTIYDDREIRSINMTIPSGYTYTSAFGYGASTGVDEDGNAILQTFRDIEWKKERGDPCDKPLGQTWLELGDEYKNKFGIRIDGQMQHRVTIANFSDIATGQNLIKRTYDFLMTNIEDQTQYIIKSIDLKGLGYETEDIRFGDTICVVITKFDNLKLKARVRRYQEDLKNPANNSFELNNYKKTITSQIGQIQSSVQDLGNKVDGISKEFTGSILEKWNREINADNAYLIYGDPINGLIACNAESKETATKATRLKGGSLQISNTKENGEFVWTTVLTGDGLIANRIYTGILKGNFFDFDLDSGIVKMGVRNSNGIIENPVLYLDSSGELHLKTLAKVEEKIEEIELKPTIKINPNFGTQQVYSPSTDTYIPDWRTQPLTLIPEIYVMDKLQTLDASKIAWTKKNGTLGANETVSDGILTINQNVLSEAKIATYQVVYNYAEGKSVSTELSFSLVKDGTEPADGKDAATCLIVPSGTSFTSSDGITYTPDKITLTPQFQGCGFDMWQYSSDGITWNNIVSGQYGFTIKADKTLAISNTTPLLTDTNKCLNIKLLSNQLNVVSVVTITKIKDGQKGDKGDTGVSITKVEVEYYLSTSNTTQTGGSWSTSIPAWADGKYIWSRTKTTLSNGTATTTNPVCITGGKGATGATGQGIASITTEFYLSTSKTTQTDGSWVTTMPAWENGKYVWTRSKIVYKNPTSTAYTTPVCDTGWEAVNDIEIGGRNLATGTSLMKMGGGGREKGHWRKSGLNPEVEIIDAVDAPVEGVGKILKITQTELRANCGIAQNGTPILNGQTYTMSAWVRGSADGISIALQPWWKASENSSGMHYFTTSTEWKLVEVTVENKITETGTYSASYVYISARNTVPNATIEVCGVKLEKGNKATDWTPAPEDIENDYNSKISATTKSLADLKVETDNIRLGVETIKETLIETNTGLSTLTETYNSYMQQTDQRFSLILQQSKEYTDGITQNANEIAKYFNVTTDGLEISAYDSADAEVGRVKSLMSNDRFAIKFDDTEVMQIYKDEMRIDNIKLRKSLTINPWIVSGYGSGETGGWVFKWGGF